MSYAFAHQKSMAYDVFLKLLVETQAICGKKIENSFHNQLIKYCSVEKNVLGRDIDRGDFPDNYTS